MINGCYWISPNGQIFPAAGTHISDIIADPTRFGTTQKAIESVYSRFGEHMGSEGQAREELIVDALKRGWIRLRKYPKGLRWGITIWHMTPNQRKFLKKWANAVIKTSAEEQYSDADIIEMADNGEAVHTTVDDIRAGKLSESHMTMLEEILK